MPLLFWECKGTIIFQKLCNVYNINKSFLRKNVLFCCLFYTFSYPDVQGKFLFLLVHAASVGTGSRALFCRHGDVLPPEDKQKMSANKLENHLLPGGRHAQPTSMPPASLMYHIVTARAIHASGESWPQDKARRCVVTARTILASGTGTRPAFTIHHIGFTGYYYGVY